MTLVLINPVNIPVVWPQAAPWIIQAIGESDSWADIDHVKESLEQGLAHLWMLTVKDAVRAVMVTEPIVINGKKYLVIRWCGGEDLDSWVDLLPKIEVFAEAKGFYGIQVWGRKGWERKLRSQGYLHEYTVIGKVISRELH